MDLEIPLLRMFFGPITPRNCLLFMFTPSLPNHAGRQIDPPRNKAIFFFQYSFSRFELCPSLGDPYREFRCKKYNALKS